MAYQYRMAVPAELIITIAGDKELTTEELKAQAEKVIREYCDETPGMDLNCIDGYDARLYPMMTRDEILINESHQLYGFECVDVWDDDEKPAEQN